MEKVDFLANDGIALNGILYKENEENEKKEILLAVHGKRQKFLGGTSFEDVLESYEDIVGAIVKLKELGYKNIYLQGHSLGSTKVVYTYNKLLEKKI